MKKIEGASFSLTHSCHFHLHFEFHIIKYYSYPFLLLFFFYTTHVRYLSSSIRKVESKTVESMNIDIKYQTRIEYLFYFAETKGKIVLLIIRDRYRKMNYSIGPSVRNGYKERW